MTSQLSFVDYSFLNNYASAYEYMYIINSEIDYAATK